MRLGVPTVATRVSGTRDYFDDGKTGVLVSPKDPGALREAITTLWRDPARRTVIGSAAKAYSQHRLSDEAAAETLEQMIDELLADAPSGFDELSSEAPRKHH